jgi:hypothetical protein
MMINLRDAQVGVGKLLQFADCIVGRDGTGSHIVE